MRNRLLVRRGLVLVIVGGLLAGCNSFLGRQYTNFTSYYNQFHNAKKAFEKGRSSIEGSGTRAVDRTKYMSVFLEPKEGGGEASFEKAIQKSADVLRDHPESKWVDDALLLIGKSYFYQQNYVGATQKFREAIALEGERAQEARFWLARTLVSTRRYDEAEEVLRVGLQEAEMGPWTARLYLVRGELFVRREQWEAAAQALQKGLQGDVPDEVGTRGSFLLGQVLETTGRPTAAREAYQRAQEYNPRYELRFAARLNDIQLQGMHGNASRALDRLRDLERDEKNFEQRGEMAIVRARVYREQGQYDRARRTLKNVLYRDESPSGASKGRLHYDLARLYRDAYKDFSRASAHFDTASTALGSRGRGTDGDDERQRLPDAPVDPGAQSERFGDLAERARDVARMDSLLRVGRMSDREFQAFVQELRRQRQAKVEERQEAQRTQRLQSRGRTSADQGEQATLAADTRTSDAGFLFYDDPSRVQQGRRQFEQRWGNRPRTDNWRRREAIRASAPGGEGEAGQGEQSRPGAEAPSSTDDASVQRPSDEAAALDLSAIPRDSAGQAKMEAERAVARYKLANSLFLAAGRPDSAATWYRRILQENGDQPVAKRALYALAEAYWAQGDTTAAQQAYRRLVEQYPDSDLAARARDRLDRREGTPGDTRVALADTAYARAYEAWQRDRPKTAFPQLLDVASRYPDTDAAPRALLAAGIVYWRQLQGDTTDAYRDTLERRLSTLRPTDSTASEEKPAPDRGGGASQPSPSDSDPTDSVEASAKATRDSTQSPVSAMDSLQSRTSAAGDSLQAASADRADGTAPGDPPVPDSTRAPVDTAATEGQNAGADSTRQGTSTAEADAYAPLASLLTHLTEQYPDAPQVERARIMLKLIEKRRAGPDSVRADTTAEEPPASDTTTTPPKTIADQKPTEQQAQEDDLATASDSATTDTARRPSTEQTADRAEEARQDRREDPLPAPANVQDQPDGENQPEAPTRERIDRSRGGWTLLVQTFTSSQEASTRIADVGRRLDDQWPVDVLKETRDGKTQYRLIVGQFQAKRVAVQAQKRVAEQLASRPRVWSIPKADTGS